MAISDTFLSEDTSGDLSCIHLASGVTANTVAGILSQSHISYL